ncbi:MAG TPA: sigma-70 family RNA polymerase sigma factor [Steroidobacteraceae bacterium]
MKRPHAYAAAADADLLSFAAAGDRAAFDEIAIRHGPFALRVAARVLANSAAAEDVVQEAMVRAWARAGQFDARRASFTTWLYRIVLNLCIDHRRRKPPQALPIDFDPVDPAPGTSEALEADQRRAALAAALEHLPVRQRAAMTLVYDEGLSGAETARVMGLSAKAVERLLARARAQLRECLQSD